MSYSTTKRSRGLRALQIWCQRVTSSYEPRVQITDMSKSFRNGLAFCAIIHHFRPDLMSNMDSLSPDDVFENNQLAFKVAEEHLDIPALLDPQDMVDNEQPDKFSIVTYVSQFYHMFKDADNSCKSSPNPTFLTNTNTVLSRRTRMSSLNSSSTSSGSNESTLSTSGITSENDSLLQLSSSEDTDCSLSPSTPKLLFNHDDLVAKYGEEIFSNGSSPAASQKEPMTKAMDGEIRGLCRKFVSKAVIAEEKES